MAISEPITVARVMGCSDWPGPSHMLTLQAEDGISFTTATRIGSKRGAGKLEQLPEEEGPDLTGKMPLAREIEAHTGSEVN